MIRWTEPKALTLLLASVLGILSNTLISPALPGIEAAFPNTANAALLTRMLITAPSLTVACLAPVAGLCADRFGRKRLLLGGALLFGMTGTAGLWLTSLEAIYISRMGLGMAVALITTTQMALIGDYYAVAERGSFMGVQIAATNIGGLVCLLLAGWLAQITPFMPFWLYAIAAPVAIAIWRFIDEPPASSRRMARETAAATPPAPWVARIGAVVTLTAISFICFYMIPTQIPYYLALLGHSHPATTSLVLALMTLAGGIASFVYARLLRHLGKAFVAGLGYALFATGFALIAVVPALAAILGAALLLGTATGFLMPLFLGAALDIAPPHRRGLATGAVTTSIFLGQFVSPLVSQPAIARFGYADSFLAATCLLLACGLFAVHTFRLPAPVVEAGKM